MGTVLPRYDEHGCRYIKVPYTIGADGIYDNSSVKINGKVYKVCIEQTTGSSVTVELLGTESGEYLLDDSVDSSKMTKYPRRVCQKTDGIDMVGVVVKYDFLFFKTLWVYLSGGTVGATGFIHLWVS